MWRKSSYSMANGDCVEVQTEDGAVMVRDSKDPFGPVITLGPEHWAKVIEDVQSSV